MDEHEYLDHPLNRILENATPAEARKAFNAYLVRMMRSTHIHGWLEKIGNIPAFKHREVVRGLVSTFRFGYSFGHMEGHAKGMRYERRRNKRRTNRKEGQDGR